MSAWRLQVQGARALGSGDFAGAVVSFRGAVDEDPSDFFAWLMLARSLEGQGRSPEALEAAERALSLRPEDFWALQAAGNTAARCGDHARARAFIAKAIERYPPSLVTLPKWMLGAVRFVLHLPGAKHVFRAQAVEELTEGHSDRELSRWKQWADEYIRPNGASEA